MTTRSSSVGTPVPIITCSSLVSNRFVLNSVVNTQYRFFLFSPALVTTTFYRVKRKKHHTTKRLLHTTATWKRAVNHFFQTKLFHICIAKLINVNRACERKIYSPQVRFNLEITLLCCVHYFVTNARFFSLFGHRCASVGC